MKQILSAGQTTVSALAVLPLKARDNAAQLAECLASETRINQEVRVTITPPAVNAPMSIKITNDAVTIERADAVRKAEAMPAGKQTPENTCSGNPRLAGSLMWAFCGP